MKRHAILCACTLLLCLGPVLPGFAQTGNKSAAAGVCLSAEERKLYDLINNYRKEKGLPPVTLSASLTYVAQTHAKDVANNPQASPCNLHSWSGKGAWTSMCYTSDHKESAKMWSKPKELTSYSGHGFEISYITGAGAADAQGALDAWKKSSGHNNVIVNEAPWKNMTWNAIGIGIFGGNACVWFGTMADPEKVVPGNCR